MKYDIEGAKIRYIYLFSSVFLAIMQIFSSEVTLMLVHMALRVFVYFN